MGFYFGGFGISRRGVRFRPYAGIAKPILRNTGAVGISARGTPWVKISGRRVMREMGRPTGAPRMSLSDMIGAVLILAIVSLSPEERRAHTRPAIEASVKARLKRANNQ